MSSYNLSISPVVNIVYCSVAIIYCCTLICYLYTIVLTKFTRNKDINITRYKLHLSQSIVHCISYFQIYDIVTEDFIGQRSYKPTHCRVLYTLFDKHLHLSRPILRKTKTRHYHFPKLLNETSIVYYKKQISSYCSEKPNLHKFRSCIPEVKMLSNAVYYLKILTIFF